MKGIVIMEAIGNINANNYKVIPNFFDFLEADTKKIFGSKGVFVVFNIFNQRIINEKHGIDIGDIYIKVFSESVNKVVSGYDNYFGYRFGNVDFLITLPNCSLTEVEKVSVKVEEEIDKKLKELGFSDLVLNKFVFEYNQQIDCADEFYELLLNNSSILGESKESSRRIISHIVRTFTKNIRKTLASYKEANNLALIDDVSGLSNHRAGQLYLSSLINEYSLNKKGFSVMFIDGDNLKRYNKISYEAGNQMIKHLSQIIKNAIYSEDKVFRWLSGDEFLVVLNEVDIDNSYYLADKVRKAVEEETQNCLYPTTISIGIAHFPSNGNTVEEIVNKAEKANSYAKDIGKNMVVRWDDKLDNKEVIIGNM